MNQSRDLYYSDFFIIETTNYRQKQFRLNIIAYNSIFEEKGYIFKDMVNKIYNNYNEESTVKASNGLTNKNPQ